MSPIGAGTLAKKYSSPASLACLLVWFMCVFGACARDLTSIRPNYCAFKDVIFGPNPLPSVAGVPAFPIMRSSLFDRAKIDNVKRVGTILGYSDCGFSTILSRARVRLRLSARVRLLMPYREIFSRSGSISSLINCATLICS